MLNCLKRQQMRMPQPDCQQIVRAKAQQLLAQREHGTQEIIKKLQQKHPDCMDVIAQVVATLHESDWLNERRYIEAYIRKEVALGHGPKHIHAALRQKNADAALVLQCMQESDVDWQALAIIVRVKKFGQTLPKTPADLAKQMRFLSYRGFDGDMVRNALKAVSD